MPLVSVVWENWVSTTIAVTFWIESNPDPDDMLKGTVGIPTKRPDAKLVIDSVETNAAVRLTEECIIEN